MQEKLKQKDQLTSSPRFEKIISSATEFRKHISM